MKLISWNTARRVHIAPKQAEVLLEREPDLVVLQEVTATTLDLLLPTLHRGGLHHALSTSPPEDCTSKARALCVAIVSRYSLRRLAAPPIAIPWPEKVLAVRVALPECEVEVFGTHIPPGSSNGWTKIETFEGIYNALAVTRLTPRILCGDFNAPQVELPDGRFVSWAQRVRPDGTVRTKQRIRHGDGSRWDAGERSVLRGPEAFGFSDAIRKHHPDSPGYSFVLKRKTKTIRRRFDHLLTAGPIAATTARYIHAWREEKLSDHAALEAELALVATR